jgi:predicted dehydrogenase
MSDRTARWGLLSTARINERLIPAIRNSSRSELCAVASRSQETANAYASQWSIPRAFGSYDAMLADPELDIVYLSLPNHLHVEWAERCADAGKHVLCEKPLALTTQEVDRIADAAKHNNVVIQEAAMMRFHAQTDFVCDLIAQGTIGEVRIARGLFTFTLERDQDIRWDPAMGGGSLWDVGSYCVRWFRTVLSAEPVEVNARQTTRNGVDASFSGELYFPNGAVAHFFSSMASFARSEADVLGSMGRMTLTMPWVNLPGRDATVHWEQMTGTRGVGTFNDSVSNLAEGTRTFEKVEPYQDEVNSMVRSVLDGATPVISLDESRKNIATIVALYESARVGRPVRVF